MRWPRLWVRCGFVGLTGLLPASPAQAQVIDILHTFTGADGKNPEGALLLSGSTLYGMTFAGGSASDGTIFQMGTNGAGYRLMHSFGGGRAMAQFRPGR
jgi:uncharacterized repeat protein (TIGR03803 family)